MPKLELPKFDLPAAMPGIARVDLSKVALDAKPLYAGAGVAELALTTVKEYAAVVHKRVEGYQKDASARLAGARRSVASFEPKALQAKARARLGETTTTYDQLAQRGEVLVARLRAKQASEPVVKPTATATKTTAAKTTAKKAPASQKATAKKPPAAKA